MPIMNKLYYRLGSLAYAVGTHFTVNYSDDAMVRHMSYLKWTATSAMGMILTIATICIMTYLATRYYQKHSNSLKGI